MQFVILAFKLLKPSKQPCVLLSQGLVLQTEHIQLRRFRDNLPNWLIFLLRLRALQRRRRRSSLDPHDARRRVWRGVGTPPRGNSNFDSPRAPDPKKKSWL
jgi:hypothetical protein